MTFTERLIRTQQTRREFCDNDCSAYQTACLFPILGLIILSQFTLLNNSLGQAQIPKAPSAQNFQQVWSANPNNNLTSYSIVTNNPPSIGLEQSERNKQELVNRQQQLESIYKELEQPSKEIVKYDLPSCSEVQGASSYREAFSELSRMANGEKLIDIKQANFLIENAFYDNQGKFENFDLVIKQIGQFLKWKMEELNYNTKSNLAKNLILYRFFADTLEIKSKKLKHLPFKYDFDDYMGNENWSKMFVEKALALNSGQCHSLPLLYLIIANEIGAKAQLSYSPNHTYVKFQDDKGKWHNVELTNGMMTTDAFILQSGYIKAEALQNKIYMQPLNEKQLLSHSMCDLANGYTKKFCYDKFVEEVINKALELDPNNINAHMLKSDYLTLQFRYIETQLDINEQNYRQILPQYPIAKDIFIARSKQYTLIDNLGYENMPATSYEKWLNSLRDAKQKQESDQLFLNMNKTLQLQK